MINDVCAQSVRWCTFWVFIPQMTSKFSLGLKKWVQTPWGVYQEISIPCGILSDPPSVTTLWYECENTKKVPQRCIVNFLQWVWLDKSSDKFIQSVYLNFWMTSPWNRASIDRTGGERHATITYEKVRLDMPSFWIERNDQEMECLKLLSRYAQH